MIKRQYTYQWQINAKGFVAQTKEEIVGYKQATKTAYFSSQEVFLRCLNSWSLGRYDYYESPNDKWMNENKNQQRVTNYKEVDSFTESSNVVYHNGYQDIQWIKWLS